MKKQIIPKSRGIGTGLNLSKRTISNLNAAEMNQQVGAAPPTKGYTYAGGSRCNTQCGHYQCH